MPELNERLSFLFSSYMTLLGRIPDWEGFIDHFGAACPTSDLYARIMQSDEYRRVNAAAIGVKDKLLPYADKRRVLLFGAFGNGNLGDRIMAQTVADKIEEAGDIACFSYSELNSASYPFMPNRQLTKADMPLNLRVMALFDAVIIGGGGLLSYTHEPLWDPAWPYTAPTAYGLLSCGVKVPLDERLRNLVDHAAVVSSRDLAGYEELGIRRDDVLLCPDPVLSFTSIAARRVPSKARLFILRAPFCDWHRALKEKLRPSDAVAVFEAHMDHEITSYFDDVHSVNSKDDFFKLAGEFEVVISERYHGVILAIIGQIPSYGIFRDGHSDKFVSLFNDLNISQYLINSPELNFDFPAYDLNAALQKLATLRSNAVEPYRKFVEQLFLPKHLAKKDSSKSPIEFPSKANDITIMSASMRRTYDDASSALDRMERAILSKMRPLK